MVSTNKEPPWRSALATSLRTQTLVGTIALPLFHQPDPGVLLCSSFHLIWKALSTDHPTKQDLADHLNKQYLVDYPANQRFGRLSYQQRSDNGFH